MRLSFLTRTLLAAFLCTVVAAAHAQFRVIYYHAHPNFGYSDSMFTEHMEFLHDNGYHTVTPDQFIGWMTNNDPLPIRPILVGFDDNYVRTYTSAFLILQAHGFKAVSFAHTDYVGVGGANDHADWIEINEMEASGVISTESHTKTHPNLTTLSPTSLQTELQGSKAGIQSNIPGKTCKYLAYPGGAYNATVTSATQAAGYTAAFTTVEDVNHHTTPLFELRRLNCDGKDLNTFKNRIGFDVLPPSPPGPGWTIDNKDVNFFHVPSDWQTTIPPSGAYGPDCLSRSAGSAGKQARWAAYLPETGTWRVHAWWVAGADRSPNAVYQVKHAGGITPVSVNQRTNGGQWNLLGTYDFSASRPAEVILAESPSGVVLADGVWFEPVTSSVDDFMRY